jgi:hypothetical protein
VLNGKASRVLHSSSYTIHLRDGDNKDLSLDFVASCEGREATNDKPSTVSETGDTALRSCGLGVFRDQLSSIAFAMFHVAAVLFAE